MTDPECAEELTSETAVAEWKALFLAAVWPKEKPRKKGKAVEDVEDVLVTIRDESSDLIMTVARNVGRLLRIPRCANQPALGMIVELLATRLPHCEDDSGFGCAQRLLSSVRDNARGKLGEVSSNLAVEMILAFSHRSDIREVELATLVELAFDCDPVKVQCNQLVALTEKWDNKIALQPLIAALPTGSSSLAVLHLAQRWPILANHPPELLRSLPRSPKDKLPGKRELGVTSLPKPQELMPLLMRDWPVMVGFLAKALASYRSARPDPGASKGVIAALREWRREAPSELRLWVQLNWIQGDGWVRLLEDLSNAVGVTGFAAAVADYYGPASPSFRHYAWSKLVEHCGVAAMGDGPWLLAGLSAAPGPGDEVPVPPQGLMMRRAEAVLAGLPGSWRPDASGFGADAGISCAVHQMLDVLVALGESKLKDQAAAAELEREQLQAGYETELREAEQRYQNVRDQLEKVRQDDGAARTSAAVREAFMAVIQYADDLDNLARSSRANDPLAVFVGKKLEGLLAVLGLVRVGQVNARLRLEDIDPTIHVVTARHDATVVGYVVERPGYRWRTGGREIIVRQCELRPA